MENLLSISNLSVSFATKKVLKNCFFSLNKQETLAIVGESGSGKSLSVLSIMGLLPYSAKLSSDSSIQYNKENLLINIKEVRGRKISMIFQEPMTSLNPVYTCGEQVDEGIIKHLKLNKNEARVKTLVLFSKVRLKNGDELYNKYPHELSGGQKQRVMIACAIACEPDILIADEPTTALDVTVQKDIIDLLFQLKDENEMSLIFITHDLSLVSEIANNVIVMNNGEIVEKGSIQQVFENPESVYTRALLSCRPSMTFRYKRLPIVSNFTKGYNEQSDVFVKITAKERELRQNSIYCQDPILEVKNLHVSYVNRGYNKENTKVINDVSFNLFKRESLGLVGESGCGKTTLGRSIVSLINSDKGQVIFHGTNIFEEGQKGLNQFRKKVQIIFQDPYSSLNPRLTVGEAIMEPMTVHKIHKNKQERESATKKLLSKVGLPEQAYFLYPHEFSGGQRQRINIARTLALQPEVIICDESVSALDVSVQAQVLNLFKDLQDEFGLTYIFISHDLSVVRYFCDKIIVLNQRGNIEEKGDSDELFNNPKSDYTKKLLSSLPTNKYNLRASV